MYRRKWSGTGILALSLMIGAGEMRAADAGAPAVDPAATEKVQAMAHVLASLKAARVSTEYALDVVLENGQKLQYSGVSTVLFQRPDKLSSERIGERGTSRFTFDGKRATLHVMPQNFYATREAPPTIDEFLDFALERLDMAPPGMDLLYSDGGGALLEGVTSGFYIGTAMIAGRSCHHVALRAPDVDWQLWIEDGERPLPCRYLISTVDVEGRPGMSVTFREWDTAPRISDNSFSASVPEGAKLIPFAEGNGETAEGSKGGSK